MSLLERLAAAALERRDVERRALWMELSRQVDVGNLERPNVQDARVLAVAAALTELLAEQKGQEAPEWTSGVGPLPKAVYLMSRSSERGYQRLRVETPRPFSCRNLYSSAKYLQLV
ncbi:MAG: hypothetical protein RL701_195 [Pseudomonadota bacterium]